MQTLTRFAVIAGAIHLTAVGYEIRYRRQTRLRREMNTFLLSTDENEALADAEEPFDGLELSRIDVAINHWIDIAEPWLDRYIVTPLLGPNQSALR